MIFGMCIFAYGITSLSPTVETERTYDTVIQFRWVLVSLEHTYYKNFLQNVLHLKLQKTAPRDEGTWCGAFMAAIDYLRINANRYSHKKMTNYESLQISHYAKCDRIHNNSQKKNVTDYEFLSLQHLCLWIIPAMSVQPVIVCRCHKVLVEELISQSYPEGLIGKYDFLRVLSN